MNEYSYTCNNKYSFCFYFTIITDNQGKTSCRRHLQKKVEKEEKISEFGSESKSGGHVCFRVMSHDDNRSGNRSLIQRKGK